MRETKESLLQGTATGVSREMHDINIFFVTEFHALFLKKYICCFLLIKVHLYRPKQMTILVMNMNAIMIYILHLALKYMFDIK